MNEFLKDLKLAYDNIQPAYYNNQVIHSQRGTALTTQEIERVVQAELYHQWRRIMELKTTLYNGLILHSEIGKVLQRGEEVKHPDLVLHGGQVGPNRGNMNKVFVELKMNVFDKDDLDKAFYALVNLEYDSAVCIIHNMSMDSIREEFVAIQDSYTHRTAHFSKLYFMNRYSVSSNLQTLLHT